MKSHLLAPLCALVACASISGTQTFETTRQFTLPDVGAAGSNLSAQTITAVGAAGQLSFADSVLNDVDDLRERDHIDSADASVRVRSIRLSTNTTFAGVDAIRVQLVTGSDTIELCNLKLSAAEQKASTIDCDADHVMDEDTLQDAAGSPTEIGAQLDVSGAVTATQLRSVVSFEIAVNVDASL